uniref:Uncharacterized protein n=1 Tax=Arundo donax TaxID=35708 RepID=A0A0A9B0V1_ARUDO
MILYQRSNTLCMIGTTLSSILMPDFLQ